MAIRTESFAEGKFLDGKAFSYLTSEAAVLAAANLDLVFTVGDLPAIIRSIKVRSDADSISWQAFAGVDHTAGTGTPVTAIRRNSLADTKPVVVMEKNPTITSPGAALFSPAEEIIGIPASGNRSLIDVDLLTDLFAATANVFLLLRITNTNGSAARININTEIWNN